jgi:hypothetical protein
MAKKIVSLLTIVAFLVFIHACTVYSTKEFGPDVAAQKTDPDVRVTKVMKTSAEIIEFGKDTGRIKNNVVVGISIMNGTMDVSREDIQQIIRGDHKEIKSITTKDGKFYSPIFTYREMPDKIALKAYKIEHVSVPLSDLEMVWLKERNPAASVSTTLGLLLIVVGAGLLYNLTKGASCPILYSLDNLHFEREGEIYSGAVFKEIERTDYLKLHHLAENKGAYALKISNEAEETQYTDEVKLLVVEHPKGSSVFVGSDGVVHTIQDPLRAVSAKDLKGTDFTAALEAPDNRMWSSNPYQRNPDNAGDLKSGIILKFPKPADAHKAKLVVRIGNTFWIDYLFVRSVGLMGDLMNAWYQQAAQSSQFKEKAESFIKKQGVALRAQLLKEGQWEDIGYFHPTGPVGLQEDILEFPADGTAADNLTVKLDGGTFFWMVDYAAIDYATDLAIKTHEVSPVEVIDENGRDIKESLLRSDDVYYTMPKPGNFAVLKFPVLPKTRESEQSFFLKSEGYYSIHPP